jgi:hypothetical protein
MKKFPSMLCALTLLLGTTVGQAKTLQPQPEADTVRIRKSYGSQLPVETIKESARITRFVAFVNSLPPKWRVPWYGAPVGKVYFEFYRDGKFVGNFYVGPNFFGRDGGGFWSQKAARRRFDELSSIVGFDLWVYVHEKSSPVGTPDTHQWNWRP